MKQGYVLLLHENFLGDSLILLALKNEDILVGKLIATCTSDYKSSWLTFVVDSKQVLLNKNTELVFRVLFKTKTWPIYFPSYIQIMREQIFSVKTLYSQLAYLPETYVHFVSSCKGIFCKIEPVICWKLPLDSVQSTRTVVPRAMRL